MEGGCPDKSCGAGEVTDAEDPFGVYPAIGDDAEERGGEDRGDAHCTIYATNLYTIEMQDVEHVAAKRDEPGAPNEEFEKVHDGEPKSDTHAIFDNVCRWLVQTG